ncbi:glycoside hydrolase family 172 protein [Pedobacter sp. Leaf250]|uniref:glycoside hydrolase family 172 protein n=1 Tax=Pedobacter sp. Leaf250 TaxID=2876559 RepID=UPI001E449D8C|nr:glycoside hydrolase family 172 protein [Pedobacter sp. Leaf250]
MEISKKKNLITRFCILWLCCIGLQLVGCADKIPEKTVTMSKLLEEMVSVEEQSRVPKPFYIAKQVSSHDRSSTKPDSANWFANADGFGNEGVDTISGHIEKILFNEQGPGVITRIWLTTLDKRGVIRFYFDGQKKAGWTIPSYDLMKFGGIEIGKGLLIPHTSYTPEGKGGSTLFMPIPYSKSCKITFEDSKDVAVTPKYYQINYRAYKKGTTVETFSAAGLKRAKQKIKEVNEILLHPPASKGKVYETSDNLLPGDSLVLDLPAGQYGIYDLDLNISQMQRSAYAQVMKKIIFSADFDHQQTIWVPLSDFSGGGTGSPRVRSWYLNADGQGKVNSRWLMPYRKLGKFVLKNVSEEKVSATISAKILPLAWDERSLYFHTSWKAERGIYLHDKPEEYKKVREWNFASLSGFGIYKGDVLTIFNHSPAWYGEGDEKIWVDNEQFPSHFGTGTEDYYNSSWAPVVPFQTPFGGAPRADQESSHGYNTFFRTRNLDGIAFTKGLKFDLEMLSWVKGKMDCASTVYWYGGKSAHALSSGSVTDIMWPLIPVPEDLGKFKEPGSIEFERLSAEKKDNAIQIDKQQMYGFIGGRWSEASQMTARGGKPGDGLTFRFNDLKTGNYKMVLYCTKASDYGIISFKVNGKQVAVSFDGYQDKVSRAAVSLGTFASEKGQIALEVFIKGANKKMSGKQYMFGLDCIQLVKTGN